MKAIVCVGPLGCGKSTFAATLPDYVESNRDAIRTRLLGRVDNHADEPQVTAVQRAVIAGAAQHNQDVIVSDTNLHPRFRAELIAYLESLGYQVEIKLFPVPIGELLRRNETRDKPVPESVLHRMAQAMTEQFPESSQAFVSG